MSTDDYTFGSCMHCGFRVRIVQDTNAQEPESDDSVQLIRSERGDCHYAIGKKP